MHQEPGLTIVRAYSASAACVPPRWPSWRRTQPARSAASLAALYIYRGHALIMTPAALTSLRGPNPWNGRSHARQTLTKRYGVREKLTPRMNTPEGDVAQEPGFQSVFYASVFLCLSLGFMAWVDNWAPPAPQRGVATATCRPWRVATADSAAVVGRSCTCPTCLRMSQRRSSASSLVVAA